MFPTKEAVTCYGVIEAPVIPDLATRVLAAIEAAPDQFDMGRWHAVRCYDGRLLIPRKGECGTVHCIGGWAVLLAGEQGRKLEETVGVEAAARALFANAATGHNPQYFCTQNDLALEHLRDIAAQEQRLLRKETP